MCKQELKYLQFKNNNKGRQKNGVRSTQRETERKNNKYGLSREAGTIKSKQEQVNIATIKTPLEQESTEPTILQGNTKRAPFLDKQETKFLHLPVKVFTIPSV